MPTAQKAKQIDALVDHFERSQLTVVANYRGLSVSQLQELRGSLRDNDAEFRVAKNTLTSIAAGKAGVEIPEDDLEGPTALMFAYDDVVAPAKALRDFVRSSRVLEIKSGLMDGQVLSSEDIEALASMPPREELLGKLVGMLASPMARTVGVLGGPSHSLAYVLSARAEQLSVQADAAD